MKDRTFKRNNIKKLKRFFIIILAIIATHLLFYFIQEIWLCKWPDFALFRKYQSHYFVKLLNDKSLLYIIIIPLIVAPILEEIMFRSWLIISPINISLFIGSLPYIIFNKLLSDFSWEVLLIISLCTGIILYKLSIILLSKFQFKWMMSNKLIVSFIIFSSISFGLAHILNYPQINIYSIILIVPNIIVGFGLAYIRIKNGLAWSILMHSLNNLPIAIVFLVQNV